MYTFILSERVLIRITVSEPFRTNATIYSRILKFKRLENPEHENGLEKVWHEKLAKRIVISRGILPTVPLNFTILLCPFFADIEKFRISLEISFDKMLRMQNLSKEIVIENWETVMEKSWGKRYVGTMVTCIW